MSEFIDQDDLVEDQEGTVEQEEHTDSNVEESTDESFGEEAVEDSGDSALSDEEEIVKEDKPKKKRVSGKTRINQLYREKSQAEHETLLLRAEVDRLRQLNELSNTAAMSHYDKAIQLQIDRLKQVKADAMMHNDVDAQIEADVQLSKAAAQQEAMEAWKAQHARQQPQQYEQQQYQQQHEQQQPEYNEATESWLQNNSWFDPQSDEYDAEMQQEVKAYADSLDRRYKRTGHANKILSPQYFQEIDEYVAREFYGEEPKQPNRSLTMRPAQNRAPVAPVNRAGQQGQQRARGQKITLTNEQRDHAKWMGLTEESYLKGMMVSNKMLADKGRN